ncbi:L,D-transpeptidase [Ensifer aridi]|uniref:L,D-transpeptidase n=1 Tax=Ensifer aridi TaxID=1708715 RepID=UPI000479F0B7|nr:L,D-transpeptidase [Ensifer aridi]
MCVSRLAQPLTLLLVLAALAGCATSTAQQPRPRGPDPYYMTMYGPIPEEMFPLPATDISKVDPRFLRQQVPYPTHKPPGTIVIDTPNKYLYLVQDGGMALRYGIGVGKAGLEFAGEAHIGRKAVWPRWIPTSDMVAREPERYGPLAGGMDPGPTNPLGPRALYLYQDGRDTLFRIHGTTEAWSIGQAVSSGCIRMFNPDIIDLYNRVPEGTRVVVIQAEPPISAAMPPADAPIGATADGAPLSF